MNMTPTRSTSRVRRDPERALAESVAIQRLWPAAFRTGPVRRVWTRGDDPRLVLIRQDGVRRSFPAAKVPTILRGEHEGSPTR